MTTYTANIWGDSYEITADFAQASCPVHGDEHGRQVADFRHSPRAAMKSLLREMVEMGGDDPDEDEFADKIEAALDAMTQTDEDESPKYKLRSTESGYSVVREDGDYAEFCDSDEADEAMKLLMSGDKSEDDYEWTN